MKCRLQCVLLAGTIWASALPVAAFYPSAGRLPNLDQRQPPTTPLPAERATARSAAEGALRKSVPRLKIDRHALTGSPNWITARDGFLTQQNGAGAVSLQNRQLFANDPHGVVKAFVQEHAGLFEHDARALSAARIAREFTAAHNQVRTVVWQQEHEGIPVFEGLFMAHTTANGEIINLSSQFLRDPAAAARSGMPNHVPGKAPSLSTAAAIALAIRNLGHDQAADDVAAVGEPAGPELRQSFRAPGAKGEIDAHLTWLPLDDGRTRLCWEIYLTSQSRGELYRFVVDAETGAVWLRHCLTSNISPATYRVFTQESPTPFFPGYPNPGSNAQPATVNRTLQTLSALNVTASPNGWINDGGNETVGNNVDAHLDLNDDDAPDLPRPQGSPSRVFDFPINIGQSQSTYRNAAVVNLFYWCNWMHDKLYELGFTEGAGNFQTSNFGKGGTGGDAVQADAQDGSGLNNANFGVGPDGGKAHMQMYIFDGPTPDRDGDLDATIILHEYTHGLSGRLVGGGVGITQLQAEGMGEGWSDFYALSLLSSASNPLTANYAVGSFVLLNWVKNGTFASPGDNYYFGIRRYPYSTNLSINPLTFKDIDPNSIDPHAGVPRSGIFPTVPANEVHSMGEVWCMMLWEMRTALIGKLGFNTGNQLALQVVTDGMKYGPPNPTYVQARDAILQAELADSGGANKNELWAAFAKRGLGPEAVAPSANSTANPVEDFSIPDTLKVTPLTEVKYIGPAGGPFTFISTNFTLSNSTASSLGWTATAPSPFIASATSGTLAANGKSTVTISLVPAQVPLAVTNFPTLIRFSNQVTHVSHTRRLLVNAYEPLWLSSPPYLDKEFQFIGPQGGPFVMNNFGETTTIVLTNLGSTPMTWRADAGSAFTVTPSSGTLAAGAGRILDVQVSDLGAQLPFGDYTNSLVVSNVTLHTSLQRDLKLTVGNDTYLTALYNVSNPLDITNKTISFFPDNSMAGYAVCVTPAAAFPTDPAGGTQLSHTASLFQTNAAVVLSGGKQVTLFGHSTNRVWVDFNGAVTLDGPIPFTAGFGHFNYHFAHLQVSALCQDYYDGYAIDAGAVVSWKQTSDRFAATWQTMPSGYGGKFTNDFQIELFFNGVVRITVLRGHEDTTVFGLSRALGAAPDDYFNTDFGAKPDCSEILPDLVVTLPASATEGVPLRAGAGRVSIASPAGTNITVSLSSSDTSEITVPLGVTIPAGSTSAVFNITVVNDSILDGTRSATITASALFYNPGHATMLVYDNESTVLHVQSPSTLTEGAAFSQGKVFTTVPVDEAVTVFLNSSPPGAVQFGGFFPIVSIAAGQTSAVFQVRAVNNNKIDGTRTATISASVVNWPSITNTVQILDDETTNLTAIMPLFLSEGAGVLSNAGVVRISGTLPTNLTVNLSSDAGFDYFPLGPVVIAAGSTSAPVTIYVGDNGTIDPVRLVSVTATAPGFSNGVGGSFLFDNDGPPDPVNPYPPDFSDDIPVTANLSWGKIEGELVVNGGFEAGNLSGWTRQDNGTGGFITDHGAFDPESPDGALPPFAGAYCALSHQLGNGTHALYQDIAIPSGATSVVLTWASRVRNFADQFLTNQQQFRVEIRDAANDTVLWIAYASQPGDPLLGEWELHTNYLNGYRGSTVRLAFVEDDQLGYMNVGLDNVSVQAGSPAPTTFDVYFGTNAVPGPDQRLGSTANNFWNLPLLAGGTEYYWRVDTKRAGMTNTGPVWTFRTSGQSSNGTLIAFHSSWKYWAQGTDLGTAWRSGTYSDAAWPTGAGYLGFGGNENTTIANYTNGYVTFYFRKQIVVTNVARISDLTARLIRDDGAVVFINGAHAFDENMPVRTTINYTTQAASVISGTETIPVTNTLSPSYLVNGTNTIAVEVHQKHGIVLSTDLLFDLELKANFNVANEPPTISMTSPADFTTVHSPTNVTLQASVTDDAATGLSVTFFANGAPIGFAGTAPFSLTWTNPIPGDYAVIAVATDSGGLTATSAPIHLLVAPAADFVFTLIPAGSEWRYSDTGDDLGTAWARSKYDDSGWSVGPAQLGYGDGDEATVLNAGDDGPESTSQYITYYFRRAFTNTMNVSNLILRVLRDDGVVVYLNGTEIYRNNMPAGTINYLTLASTNVGVPGENTFYSALLPATRLITGANVLAVEVHQASTHSGDLSFDLELDGVGTTRPTVALTSPYGGSVYVTPTNVPIAGIAAVTYAAITKLEFFADGISLGAVSNAPYEIAWPNPAGGSHMLTAVATDSHGGVNTSYPAFITVLGPVSLALQQNGGQLQLTWPVSAGNYQVDSTTNLTPPVTWVPVTNAIGQSNGLFVLPVQGTGEGYFRLRGP